MLGGLPHSLADDPAACHDQRLRRTFPVLGRSTGRRHSEAGHNCKAEGARKLVGRYSRAVLIPAHVVCVAAALWRNNPPIVYCGGHQVAHDRGPTLAHIQGGHEITLDALSKSRRWTADELAELKRLSHHAPVEEIAAALGRTVSGIRTKASQKRIALHCAATGPTSVAVALGTRTGRG